MNETLNPVEVDGRKYIRVAEAKNYLGLSLRSIYYMIDSKNSPFRTRVVLGVQAIELESLRAEKARREAEKKRGARMSQHKCAAPDCTRQISTSLLMCPPHWNRVPAKIQTRVYAAWRARQAGKAGAVSAHEAAKSDAIASLGDAQ